MSTRKLFKENVYMKTTKAVITDIFSDEKGLILTLTGQFFSPREAVKAVIPALPVNLPLSTYTKKTAKFFTAVSKKKVNCR